jgi:hypothetical protein
VIANEGVEQAELTVVEADLVRGGGFPGRGGRRQEDHL